MPIRVPTPRPVTSAVDFLAYIRALLTEVPGDLPRSAVEAKLNDMEV